MNGNIGVVIAVGAFLLLGAYLMTNQASLDFASPLRNRLWARDERRMQQRQRFPESIERSYWTMKEYERDRPRLEALGYELVSEVESEPYVTGYADPRSQRPPPRRRVPVRFVIYTRTPPRDSETPDGTPS